MLQGIIKTNKKFHTAKNIVHCKILWGNKKKRESDGSIQNQRNEDINTNSGGNYPNLHDNKINISKQTDLNTLNIISITCNNRHSGVLFTSNDFPEVHTNIARIKKEIEPNWFFLGYIYMPYR